jgi:hypothetical protein
VKHLQNIVDADKLLADIREMAAKVPPGPEKDHLIKLAGHVQRAIGIQNAALMLSDKPTMPEPEATKITNDVLSRFKLPKKV